MSAAVGTERELLLEGAASLGVPLDAIALDRLTRYLDALVKWNRVHNLTAVRERAEMVTLHLLDSLAVLPHLPRGRLIDIGTGAGLPGLPIAIAQPDRPITLLDSNQKKTAFLRHAVAELGLAQVEIVAERAEAYRPAAPSPLAISRAFAELSSFAAACARLLEPSGRMFAMKGHHPSAEIDRLAPALRVLDVIALHVPGLTAARHLIVMDRIA